MALILTFGSNCTHPTLTGVRLYKGAGDRVLDGGGNGVPAAPRPACETGRSAISVSVTLMDRVRSHLRMGTAGFVDVGVKKGMGRRWRMEDKSRGRMVVVDVLRVGIW